MRRRIVSAVVFGGLLGTGGYTLCEPGRLVVREHTLEVGAGTRPVMRVAVLTDLHVGSPWITLQHLEEVVGRTNAEEPDLVVILGDLVIHGVKGGRFVEPEPIARALGELRAPLGVHAVLGNHDWWLDGPRIRSALEAVGIAVHENEAVVLATEPAVWLVGIGDSFTAHDDIRAAVAKVPPESFSIAITHAPDVFPDVPPHIDLTVAGHTHGGQVALPLIGRPVVPSEFGQRYAHGHVSESGHDLYVSSGIGTSILPVRFGVPPEITVLELKP